jgi:DNA polymerase-3 subunit gamma/tau
MLFHLLDVPRVPSELQASQAVLAQPFPSSSASHGNSVYTEINLGQRQLCRISEPDFPPALPHAKLRPPMAYTVLARRYRSNTFDDVVGQNHVAQTLKKAITTGRIAHAYLFTGTRGVGKTSMARIMAKALNCLASDGPTPTPCLKCASCIAIARGDDIDVIEIDAASNTQVEKTRDVIIDNAQFRPARSRFKIYIIDEVHMLSKASFNALLKTMEEPPEHVKFILATTEIEKVLPTILSRCQRYDFRNIPTREIADHLRSICKDEKIQADEDALMLVAKAGAGSMRDSLSLLDRLLSIGEKKLTVESIEQLLGLPRSQAIFDLAQAMGEGRVKDVLGMSDRLISEGLSVDGLLVSLIDHLRNLLILRTCGADSALVEVAALSLADLNKQAGQFDAVVLSQDITILEDLRRQLRQSSAGRALLDATLVRLALAEQFTSIADLLNHVDGQPAAAPVQKKKLEPAVEIEPVSSPTLSMPVPVGPPAPLSPISSDAPILHPPSSILSSPPLASDLDLDDDDSLPTVGKVWDEGPKLSLSAIMKQHAAKAPAEEPIAPKPIGTNIEAVDSENLPAVWQQLLDKLSEKASLQTMVKMGRLVSIVEDQAVIRFNDSFFANSLNRGGKRELLSDTLTTLLGKPTGVRFEIAESPEIAPPEPQQAAPRNGNGQPHRPPSPHPPTAPPSPQPSNRLTPDQIAEFQKDPLIGGLMAEFDAVPLKLSDD